jgi:hypothetical protein
VYFVGVAMDRLNRRDMIKMGAAGGVGVALAGVGSRVSGGASAAGQRLSGIHISVPTTIVSPDAAKGFPHDWTLTVYGPDNALNGMGWGGATDMATLQQILNSKMFPCIYSLTGAVEGDLVKVHGLMLFSGAPDQGMPLEFEGNLTTGVLRVVAYRTLSFEGRGVVARI